MTVNSAWPFSRETLCLPLQGSNSLADSQKVRLVWGWRSLGNDSRMKGEKKDLPEDLLEMFCKFPPWSLGRVLQLHTRNLCPDAACWGCGSSACQRFLLCLLSSPGGQWQGSKMTPFIFFFFGHFHFILLLWSDSPDEELGSFSSSCCINECKT